MREFDGWTPRTVTEHEYKNGRLIRSVTTTESAWDPQEQGWMLALSDWEAGRCPICGGDPDECWAVGADGAYQVPDPIRCHRATAVAVTRKTYDTNPDVRAPGALIFWAERRGAGSWPTGPSQSG